MKHVSLTRRLLLSAGASFALPAGGALLSACAGDPSFTEEERVVLETRVRLAAGGERFTTALGWQVTLTRALLATGPFYYFSGEPALASLARAFALRSAHAHPGHYDGGDALGQLLEPYSLDLLAGEVDLPAGEGVTGSYRSGSFSFSAPARGPRASELGDAVALVEGSASRGDRPARYFGARATLADVARSAAQGHVEGCAFQEVEVTEDGIVTVTVAPRAWFDLVDFELLPPGSEAEPVELVPGTQPAIAFAQGLAQRSAYSFAYEAAP